VSALLFFFVGALGFNLLFLARWLDALSRELKELERVHHDFVRAEIARLPPSDQLDAMAEAFEQLPPK